MTLHTLRRSARATLAAAGLLLGWLAPGLAADPTLTIALGGAEQRITATALLARPDTIDIAIPNDQAYGRAMSYRAVPLAALIDSHRIAPGRVLEARAGDGFTATVPLDCLPRCGGAEGYLAVEPPDKPWPPLPGKEASAGPFYLVWKDPASGGIRSEQWPYQVVLLTDAESPVTRWPGLAVDPALPTEHPVRAGQAVFAALCMACHTLNRQGSGAMGPDLNLPMNPTEYLKPAGLKAIIRNTKAVRDWPGQQMTPFTPEMMSERELDLVVAYLEHMAGRKTP